jgi:hypothetical protein
VLVSLAAEWFLLVIHGDTHGHHTHQVMASDDVSGVSTTNASAPVRVSIVSNKAQDLHRMSNDIVD